MINLDARRLDIYLDPSCGTISRRQLDLLNGLLAVVQERLDEIKTQLYERWEEYDHFFTDEIEFEYDWPDAAFEASQIRAVVVNSLGTAHADRPILRFKVIWDPERAFTTIKMSFDGRSTDHTSHPLAAR